MNVTKLFMFYNFFFYTIIFLRYCNARKLVKTDLKTREELSYELSEELFLLKVLVTSEDIECLQ